MLMDGILKPSTKKVLGLIPLRLRLQMRPGKKAMYRGLPKNFLFDFDPYLDLERLRALEIPTCRGIAKSTWNIGQVGTGHTRENQQDITQAYRAYENLPDNHPMRVASSDLSFDQKRRFIALQTQCLTLGFSLTLRAPHDFFVSKPDDPFNILNVPDTPQAKNFPELLAFIDALPFFEAIGRVNIFVTPPNSGSEIHRDYGRVAPGPIQLPHFVWFRFDKNKPFFLFDLKTNKKTYVQGYSCWFNSNQYHGSDPVNYYSYSIRVDGKFTKEMARDIGINE